jgi:hypothetical protein
LETEKPFGRLRHKFGTILKIDLNNGKDQIDVVQDWLTHVDAERPYLTFRVMLLQIATSAKQRGTEHYVYKNKFKKSRVYPLKIPPADSE